MPFDIGLSGLNAANADLKTTANNIANTATIGFKASRAEFANVYSLTKFGAAETAIGKGVRVSGITQLFTQGNISFTENNLDIAINGDGFFNMVDQSGNKSYTRNGQFKVDKNGYIVNNDGRKLQGYQVVSETDDNINTGDVGDLRLKTTQIAPNPTTTASLIANVDASSTAIAATTDIDPKDPTTYHHTTSLTTYDSLGNEMLTTLYFQKNADASGGGNSQWTVGVRTVDAQGNAHPADTAGPPVVENTDDTAVEFDTTGKIKVPDPAEISYTLTPTSADAQTITIDISNVTQYGANFSVTDIQQNGYSTGNLSGIEIDQGGVVLARYTNGETTNLGQIILSGFANPQGLGQIGDNQWVESYASGQPVVNTPGNGSLGLIQSGALEEANVNLTEELISLITAQRNFQANAKTISTANTIAQTIINI